MKTLNEEITRIKSEVADITSKAFTGKTIQQIVKQRFATIIPQEYEASEVVWNDYNCSFEIVDKINVKEF